MRCHGSQGRLRSKVKRKSVELMENNGGGLRDLLPPQIVQRAVEAEGIRFRQSLFTPLVTLWMFLAQVLSADGSCREAVARLLAFLAALGGSAELAGDPETGPYCKARQRLSEPLVRRLARETGRHLHNRYPSGPLLGGRKVKVVDGTVCSMPDTPLNQNQWPQPSAQKPGLGFPLVRLVAVMSMSCAAVLDIAMGPYKGKQTGETALLRSIMDSLERGEVLLADRYYASFWMIALLQDRGVDSLFRQHQKRKIDFRRGRRLGHDDHLIELKKPKQRPEWMDQAAYKLLPGR